MLKSSRWEIYANYSIHDREECLEGAKELDLSRRFEAVCVIWESFNAEQNTSRESVIYHSPALKKSSPVALVTQGGADSTKTDRPAPRNRDAGRKAAKGEKFAAKKTRKRRRTGKDCQPAAAPEESNLAEVLPRLAVVCIVSVVGASIIAYVFSALLQYLPLLQISFGKSMS